MSTTTTERPSVVDLLKRVPERAPPSETEKRWRVLLNSSVFKETNAMLWR